jgi:hypothetical protein
MARVIDSALEGKRKFEIKREALQMAAYADHSLGHIELRVFGVITAKYWNRNTGRAWPPTRTLASLCNVSQTSVCRALQTLVERGYLTLVGSRNRGANEYAVHLPADEVNQLDGSEPAEEGEPTSRFGVNQQDGSGVNHIGRFTEPLTEPLIEPLIKSSLRSDEEKKGDGERGLRELAPVSTGHPA